jgi:hypothetical protein
MREHRPERDKQRAEQGRFGHRGTECDQNRKRGRDQNRECGRDQNRDHDRDGYR